MVRKRTAEDRRRSPHDRCTANSKQTGDRCQKYAVDGATVCRYHGGNARQVKRKADQRVIERETRLTFGRLADHSTPVADPLTALGQLAGHVTAWMEFLSEQVADLERLRFEDVKGGEQIDGRVQLFRQALVDCNQVLGTYARLGIDDRLARISERQAEVVLKAIEAALEAVDVPAERRPDARRAAARHLRAV
jgi:hypothetical protein